MKKQEWTIKEGKNNYKIELLSPTNITINDESIDLTTLNSKNLLFVMTEYKLPIENKEVILSCSNGKWHLIVDGKDYDTNKDYTPIEKIPKWIYVFIILNATNFINGVVGICCAFLGMFLTLKVCTSKMNVFSKILLSILILIGMYIIVFAIAILLNLLLY